MISLNPSKLPFKIQIPLDIWTGYSRHEIGGLVLCFFIHFIMFSIVYFDKQSTLNLCLVRTYNSLLLFFVRHGHLLLGFELGTPTTARYQKIDALTAQLWCPLLSSVLNHYQIHKVTLSIHVYLYSIQANSLTNTCMYT